MSEDKKQAPIQTLRDGAVHVKLWRQEGPNGPFVTATLGRTYQDNETGKYLESRSLSGADVLKGHALLLDAHRNIGKWHAHYKELANKEAPQQEQGLVAQRDAALAEAKQPAPVDAPGRALER